MTRDEATAILAELQPDWTVKEADQNNPTAFVVNCGTPGTTSWNLIDLTDENLRASVTNLASYLANKPAVEKAPEPPASADPAPPQPAAPEYESLTGRTSLQELQQRDAAQRSAEHRVTPEPANLTRKPSRHR